MELIQFQSGRLFIHQCPLSQNQIFIVLLFHRSFHPVTICQLLSSPDHSLADNFNTLFLSAVIRLPLTNLHLFTPSIRMLAVSSKMFDQEFPPHEVILKRSIISLQHHLCLLGFGRSPSTRQRPNLKIASSDDALPV